MVHLILETIPLAAASALSPGLLAVSLALLARKDTRAVFAFLLGCALAALVLLAIGLGFAAADDTVAKSISQPVAIFDFIIGILLAAFGIKVLLEKEDAGSRLKSRGNLSAKKLAAIGFLGSITNFDAVLLNITAVRNIGNSASELGIKLASLFISEFFLLSPILLPLFLYFAYPAKSAKMLEPVGAWISKYGRFIVGAIFLVFGAIFILKALPALIH